MPVVPIAIINGGHVCTRRRGQHLSALKVSLGNISHLPQLLFLTNTGVLVVNFKQQLEEDMPSSQALWEMNVFMT